MVAVLFTKESLIKFTTLLYIQMPPPIVAELSINLQSEISRLLSKMFSAPPLPPYLEYAVENVSDVD